MSTQTNFRLADVLAHIAEELVEADKKARERGVAVMQFEECEVELAVKVEVEGEAGFKLWVVDLSGSATREEANKLRVKMKAIPGKPFQAPQVQQDNAPAEAVVRQQNANPNAKT